MRGLEEKNMLNLVRSRIHIIQRAIFRKSLCIIRLLTLNVKCEELRYTLTLSIISIKILISLSISHVLVVYLGPVQGVHI